MSGASARVLAMVRAHFDRDAALSLAQGVLSAPPALPHINRPAPRGALVQRFVLPLKLCPTTNRTRHSKPGQFAPVKRALLALMQRSEEHTSALQSRE